jgi:nucleoside-diphosphate-sugar epimerase
MAAQKAGVRHLVLISSIYAELTEKSSNYGIYSITKRQADELACDYCRRHSISLSVLRPSPLYAEEESFRRHQPLFYQMADYAEKGQDIPLYGQHDALRNYLHADDLSRIVLKVLENGCCGIHACTFPRDVALSEVARAAQKAFGRGGKVVFLAEKSDIPDNIFGNSTELYNQIGFYPDVDVWEGMRRIAAVRTGVKT